MRETSADNAQAVGLSLLLHGLLIAALVLGALWKFGGAPAGGGSPMDSQLTDVSDLSAAMQRTLRNRPKPIAEPLPQPEPEPEDSLPLPQPEPEPRPQDSPTPVQQSPQDFIPVPDDTSQEQVVDTPTPNPTDEQKLQEAKRRQEQVDLTAQERQLEAQRQQRLTAMELERQKQLEDIRRKRAQAAREASLAEQKLRQLADAQARSASQQTADASQPNAGAGGQGDPSLMAAYQAALQAAILAKWTRPESVPLGAKCRLVIRQLQGGTVIDVQVSSPCSYDEQARRSIEAAVLKAQPLPYAGFEKVFNRQLNFNFTAQDQ
ncbi:cell envelope integrity protein TolA [Lysobacter sp. 5GHs7-4]|uniref:cell envelope integrity protein TolA n=1 Tax=Lysobacter sp. 5GHs7-4 TaxID=2904253 RepID=UPI001E4017AC|nr:cell envelope integrity protein TolA [Lysobacter sp. 5GHs7-4]UHQ24205.1 cell envelope integrity protein TolA [Lysobacter sp. 5GHs7-4]